MIWITVLATALYAASVVQRKLFLRSSRLPFEIFFPALLACVAALGLVVAPFDWRIDPTALDPAPVLLLAVAMSLGVYWFELYYHAQREETLSRYDMLALVDPLTTLSLISILYPAERDPRIWAATGLACLVLYVGHKNHHTVQFDQGERWLLTAIGIGAVIVSIQRYLLSFYSEPALNALYTTGIASLFLWRYGLGWLRTAYRFRREFLLTAALIVSNSVLFLYSYQRFGVTLTTMISLLQPVLVAFVAYFILKEPVKPKLLVAGSAVLLIVMVTVAIVHPH